MVAKYESAIVGVWVFLKREEGVVIWHRACIDHSYRMWNPHEKALTLAIPELRSMGFQKVLTFSDNRFHTGALYENIGFQFDKDVPPNYYYTNGRDRKSKYSLRVKAGINEREVAKAKGWLPIFDSGKRRFTLSI